MSRHSTHRCVEQTKHLGRSFRTCSTMRMFLRSGLLITIATKQTAADASAGRAFDSPTKHLAQPLGFVLPFGPGMAVVHAGPEYKQLGAVKSIPCFSGNLFVHQKRLGSGRENRLPFPAVPPTGSVSDVRSISTVQACGTATVLIQGRYIHKVLDVRSWAWADSFS